MEVIYETNEVVRTRINADFLSMLERHRIFYQRVDDPKAPPVPLEKRRWKPGDVLMFRKDCVLEPYTTIGAGNNMFSVGSFGSIMSELPLNTKIGRYCSIGPGVKPLGFRHPLHAVSMSSAAFNPRREFVHSYLRDFEGIFGAPATFAPVSTPQPQFRPLSIGHDVWIGAYVSLPGGVTIGNGAVVASNTVVTKDVPSYAIIGGNPGKIIKFRFDDKIQADLEAMQWWNYELSDLHAIGMNDPAAFCAAFPSRRVHLREYKPRSVNIWAECQQLMRSSAWP